MLFTLHRAKIHRASLTGTELDYEGSIGLDRELMEAAGILPHERVQVLNHNNGERLETYVIEEAAGSGKVCLYGPAARAGQPGDVVTIIAYAQMTEEEARKCRPRVVRVDSSNRPLAGA
jgi:aspartate 1-decarboxylase